MNKPATSKEELLRTAREIAYREGIGKLNIRRLAAESGVAIGTVYNYYPSKGDLITGVMEDFWRQVFHGRNPDSGSFDAESRDFTASCREIFQRLRKNLREFEQEFLDDVMALEQAERKQGRETEAFYLSHMKEGLLRILERDPKVADEVWSDTFTEKAFVDFTFSNLILLLKEKKENCDYLEEVVRRLIYRSGECPRTCEAMEEKRGD